MLDQRRRRWADVVQMLYKCFIFAGNSSWSGIAYCWRRLQADTDPMSVKCWASVAGARQLNHHCTHHNVIIILCFHLNLYPTIIDAGTVTSASIQTSFYPCKS